MSTNDRKAKARAAAKSTGSGPNVILVAGVVVLVAMVLIIGGVIWSGTHSSTSSGEGRLPDGVSQGEPIEPYASAEPAEDAPVVDVYEDFRCPICQRLEEAMGGTIDELARDGEIRLRVHLKTVIDTNTGGESSAVAGSSAVCAADRGVWGEYRSALFARQPASETREGFPEDEYTAAAEEAGLSGDDLEAWQECTDAGTYVDYVKGVDDATVKEGVTGTPVIEVDGTRLNWGALITDPATNEADTAQLTEILTSGEVPDELVADQ